MFQPSNFVVGKDISVTTTYYTDISVFVNAFLCKNRDFSVKILQSNNSRVYGRSKPVYMIIWP